MSWTPVTDPYEGFRRTPPDPWLNRRFTKKLEQTVDIWQKTRSSPDGYWTEDRHVLHIDPDPSSFAPLDHRYYSDTCIPIFNALRIPSAFVTERMQSVCHGFGAHDGVDGSSCTWFHFLCKNIDVDRTGRQPRIVNNVPSRPPEPRSRRYNSTSQVSSSQSGSDIAMVHLSQSDYSWLRSAFFLRVDPKGQSVTLACFAATPHVRKRLEMWIESRLWETVMEQPLALLDLVVEGLYLEVDNVAWNMADVFSPMETGVLEVATKGGLPTLEEHVDFVGLYNCLRHCIYIVEGIESCLRLVDSLRSTVRVPEYPNYSGFAQPSTANASASDSSAQLLASLSHWRSVFTSTSLRVSSLRSRIENTINLCFNLVAQQDSMTMRHESMTMRQDANAMKILATINVIFLPTMAVASVLGSQLFVTGVKEDGSESGSVEVVTSPLFRILWICSVPLTFCVVALAAFWSWYTHRTYPRTSEAMRKRLVDHKSSLPQWMLLLRDGAAMLGLVGKSRNPSIV
ncbi:hypothetical protein ABW19_dt0200516 [Dactylella cylindrospora]|nr:hypothetical protein ABW19_dt0200516 [Dactylella cylindrospora]